MKAAYIESFGGPERLLFGERPRPEVGPGEVMVRIAASGVCHHDALTRKGVFPRTVLPVILGHQAAGEVQAVGSEASRFRPGDRVLCMPVFGCGSCPYCEAGRQQLCRDAKFVGEEVQGAYAEFLTLPEHAWVAVPEGLPLERAAVVACTLGTAYHAAKTVAKVVPGEKVVITGASGGIGSHAIKVLKWLGAEVLAVTTSPEKVPFLRDLGADEVVTAQDGAYSKAIKSHGGAAAVLDVVGGASIEEGLKSLNPGGRLVVIGNLSGQPVQLKPAVLILKEVSLLGTKGVTDQELREVLSLVSQGALQVVVGAELPLSGAREAHERLATRHTQGRIVLRPDLAL